jgi:hypothetical protein
MILIQWMWSKREYMNRVTALVSYTGAVSMYLFASHGILRNGFINMANFFSSPVASLLIGVSFLLFSIGISWMLMQTESSFRTWVGSANGTLRKWFRFLVVILPVTASVLLYFLLDTSTREQVKKQGAPVFSKTLDFETLEPKLQKFACSLFYQSGKQGFMLPPSDTFTPGIDAEPDAAASEGLYEAVVSARLFATDTGAQGHVVLEVIDIRSKKILEWKSNFITKDKFPRGNWFAGEYRYSVPPEYRREGYRFRAFVWNKGTCTLYVDDLKLELMARR